MGKLTEAIEAYLDFILSPDRIAEPDVDKTPELLKRLDALAIHTHLGGACDDDAQDDEKDAPDYKALRETIARHFPEYGHYSTVLEIEPNTNAENLCLGDALNDIADLAKDLSFVLWIAKVRSEPAAQYHFRFLYLIHWGFHLRQLQTYLFCRMTGF